MTDQEIDFNAEMQKLERRRKEWEAEGAKFSADDARYRAATSKSELRWKRKSEIHARRMRVLDRKGKGFERVTSILVAAALIVWLLSMLLSWLLKAR